MSDKSLRGNNTAAVQELISHGKVVTLHYTLHASDNSEGASSPSATSDENLIESSKANGEPFPYLHGFGNVVPGLEEALEGKQAGEKLVVSVDPDDGYGPYDETLKQSIPLSSFPAGTDFEKHSEFEAENEEGDFIILRVIEVNGDSVTVDGNHALAGKQLHFDVEILSVREATEAEIEHGHPHFEGSACEH